MAHIFCGTGINPGLSRDVLSLRCLGPQLAEPKPEYYNLWKTRILLCKLMLIIHWDLSLDFQLVSLHMASPCDLEFLRTWCHFKGILRATISRKRKIGSKLYPFYDLPRNHITLFLLHCIGQRNYNSLPRFNRERTEGGGVTHIVTYMGHKLAMDLPSTTVCPLVKIIHILPTHKIHMCLFQNPQTLIPWSSRFNLTQDLTYIRTMLDEAARLSYLTCIWPSVAPLDLKILWTEEMLSVTHTHTHTHTNMKCLTGIDPPLQRERSTRHVGVNGP